MSSIDHAFTARPASDERLVSAVPRCICGGTEAEHRLAAHYAAIAAESARQTKSLRDAIEETLRDEGLLYRDDSDTVADVHRALDVLAAWALAHKAMP